MSTVCFRWFVLIAFASLFGLAAPPIIAAEDHAGGSADDDPPLPEVIDFNEHIRPLLTSHCTACHGGVKRAADVSFVTADHLPDLIEPGSPDDSYLIERVTEEDDEFRMPPPEHGPRLPPREVALLKRWIEQGGKWSDHWAYQLPKRREHETVAVSDEAWPRQPIDRFVLRRLDREGIEPAPVERPERWLRRVSLDLIGLPPTMRERERFLAALERDPETAHTEVVDRLLASPRFGERWASVWFDQVRYADSRGQGEDSPREIWKYRDWVIDAINADMPYDQFTIKQLAGDLLPNPTVEDHLATAVHRLTHTNEEGGTDDEEFRVAAVIDRVQTTWQTWQGTTIGCVQCHSHPYDPIDHDEFYQSMAYFNNTADVDLSDDWPNLDVPVDKSDYALATELDRKITAEQRGVWRRQWKSAHHRADWRPLRIAKAKTNNRTRLAVENKPTHDEYHTVGTVSAGAEFTTEMPLDFDEPITGVRLTALPLDPEKALPNAEVGFVISRLRVFVQGPDDKQAKEIKIAKLIGDEPFPYSDPQRSLDDDKPGFGAFTRVHHERNLVVLPDEPIAAPAGSKLIVKAKYRILDLAAFILMSRRGYASVSCDPALTELLTDEKLKQAESRLAKLKAARDAIDSVATPVLQERPEHLKRPSHVFIRGLFLTKDKEVSPDVPAALNHTGESAPDRLAFANWLVSAGNPLTARVAVNRMWAQMFGVGLVATEEDFGSAGDQPSHPELLDDLAVRFREDYQWSAKRLLREIALSSAYRQSSRIRPELLEADAQNRLLARGPRHSLPAEAVRDQMLAISGLLSDKMHGPPVQPPLPPGVWKARRGSWRTPPVGNPDRYRRSVYTYIKRSVPFPTFATFDAPSRDFCQPKRLRSNTPLQPLMLLNDRAFVECAEAFAKLIAAQPGELESQIGYGFTRAACREPDEREVRRLVELHASVKQRSGDAGALRAVAAVLLNLDEIIMK